MISSIFDKSSTKARIKIQPLINGYLVSADRPEMGEFMHITQSWCFTDEESLGKFITEYYKEPPKEVQSK